MNAWNHPGWNLLTKEQQREALDQRLAKIVHKAYMRMQLKNAAFIPGLIKNYSKEYLAKYIAEIQAPSGDPEEDQLQQLADLLIPRLYADKKIDQIIEMAMPFITDVYKAIKRVGVSSRNSSPENRKTAALRWYRRNQASMEESKCGRLPYLKEEYFHDQSLYNEGSGQERRDFINRLLTKIVKDETGKQLTFREIAERIRKLNKIGRQPFRLEDL